MVLIAGVDIGNSTTEIVISDGPEPVAHDRRPTRGTKGSTESIHAAAALLRNLERISGYKVEHVVTAPWNSVATEAMTVQEDPPDTGRIQLINCAQHSVVGDQSVSGVPWDVTTPLPGSNSERVFIIAIVPRETGYKEAASLINQALTQGTSLCGVVMENDEAVLISSRIKKPLLITDCADTGAALCAKRLYLEVRPAGQVVQTATDVWALHSALQTEESEVKHLSLIARWVRDYRAVIVGIFDNFEQQPTRSSIETVTWTSGETVDIFKAIDSFVDHPVNVAQSLNMGTMRPVTDLWGADLSKILIDHGLRSKSRFRNIVVASVNHQNSGPHEQLEAIFSAPVSIIESEAAAASIGARTTPGLPINSLILDIGGGTIDLIGKNGISAAGAGELLSIAVAEVLNVPKGAADWIKRGPAQRVESPQVLLNEDGTRSFASESERLVPATVLGSLVTPGPSGPLPFGKSLQPAEWRIIRQSLKLEIIANNVARILRSYSDKGNNSFDIVIVGGPAADDELLPVLGRLPMVRGIGRGNVAGKLGHRYAVAYGLTQIEKIL
ncbi:MAG: hypothetical protein ACI9J2_001472 [Saprospiraceae bacterium]|jgi:hypothetical protein